MNARLSSDRKHSITVANPSRSSTSGSATGDSAPGSLANGQNRQVDWSRALSENGKWLRTVILARVGERQAVDEVFQEVALAAVEQAAPLLDTTKVAPWLYRLAIMHSLLFRRKMGRGRKLITNYNNAYPATDQDVRCEDPLVWLLSEERQRLVRQALMQLGNRDRELLLLKYTENWSYHQLAEHLGLGHSAVEARLHRARVRLRDELTRMQVVEEHV